MLSEESVIDRLLELRRTSAVPVVAMMCGVAGSGKTTFALKLEKAGFIRLSIDEDIWSTHGRFGIDYPEENYELYKEQSEQKLRGELVKLLQAKCHVVIDFSFWQRRRREEYTELIRKYGGERVLIHLKVAPDEIRQRLRIRSGRFDANAAFPITEDILSRFLSGFEAPSGEGELVIGG